ncbi:MAG TPA: purine-nucleoside phosphorylase, partial [Flavobacteriaceae bacterium]|nr:purine-nucleoside phosphorylase [Flavobacteriaceae bacterium]
MLDRINEAVKYINNLLPDQPEFVIVLGSGLGKLEDEVENKVV